MPDMTHTECGACATVLPRRSVGHLCRNCESLKAKYPDGFPPEVDAALILSRTLRGVFVTNAESRTIVEVFRQIGASLEKIADKTGDLADLGDIGGPLDRIADKTGEISKIAEFDGPLEKIADKTEDIALHLELKG